VTLSFNLIDRKEYDMRNFAVHTALAGVMGFDATSFEIMCSQAVQGISACMMSALKIMGRELNVYAQVDVYDRILGHLEHVAGFTVIDNVLRSQGEPQRYRWHKGPWPEDAGGGGSRAHA
jgi:hypothetical protein